MNQSQGYLHPIPEPFTELQLSKLRSYLDSQGSNKEKALFSLVSLGFRPIEVVSARLRVNGSLAVADVMQAKTSRSDVASCSVDVPIAWVAEGQLESGEYLFPGRLRKGDHISLDDLHKAIYKWLQIMGCHEVYKGSIGAHFRKRVVATMGLRADFGNIKDII